MWKEQRKSREASDMLKQLREVISPNAGFIVQCKLFFTLVIKWESVLFSTEENFLYRISPINNTFPKNKQAIPILCDSNNLDSRTCFILHETSTGQVYIW